MTDMRQISIGELKKGTYIMIDDVPCMVTAISVSKTGKHGATKAHVDAVGMFDDKKRIFIAPTSFKVFSPMVEKRAGQVVSISGDTAQLMDVETYETFNAMVPVELKEKIVEGGQVVYWKVGEQRVIMDVKGS